MKSRLLGVKKKYEAFEIRERMLLLGAAIACFYMICELVFMSPIKKDMKILVARERIANQSIKATESEIMVLNNLASRDPNNQLKIELDALKRKLLDLDNSLMELSNGLVSAIQLPVVLHDLLAETKNIDLLEIKTLAVTEVKLGEPDYIGDVEGRVDKDGSGDASEDRKVTADPLEGVKDDLMLAPVGGEKQDIPTVKLFKHGVRMRLTGSFGSIYEYLKKIEQSQWQFYWEEVDYGVTVYPSAQIELQVYTLSPEQGVFNG